MKSMDSFVDKGDEEVTIEIDALVKETAKAYLVDIDGDEYWFPKSQVDLDGMSLTLPEWLARKEGLY